MRLPTPGLLKATIYHNHVLPSADARCLPQRRPHVQVRVSVTANEALDERALLRRYRAEVAELRAQLAAALAAAGQSDSVSRTVPRCATELAMFLRVGASVCCSWPALW